MNLIGLLVQHVSPVQYVLVTYPVCLTVKYALPVPRVLPVQYVLPKPRVLPVLNEDDGEQHHTAN